MALRESEARFHTLADAVPQVIWANNASGMAIYFNPVARSSIDVTGIPYVPIDGDHCNRFFGEG